MDAHKAKAALIREMNRSETQSSELSGPVGVIGGTYGPNDNGYLCCGIRKAAAQLVSCSELWSEGHYPHSNARIMPEDHPIAVALAALANLDCQIAAYNNVSHDPRLFSPYMPSYASQHRWDGTEGPAGSDDESNESSQP
uniref:Uncharacterized protein n=1 Tax=viral metagenome TaxID=1070528 RepID=A0A6M3IFZ7_9ZZZZ